MIKVSAVSYLNTKPLLYGIFQKGLDEMMDLRLNIPSKSAEQLQNGEIDLGLVPVAIIPQLSDPHIISNYCIGTEGEVKTVCLFSERPLEELTHIYLDYHSRTSAKLIQILAREHWKVPVQFIQARAGFEDQIRGKVGGLIIGDRTIGTNYKYEYDLGQAWRDYTGLPFVFAAWVSNKKLPDSFIKVFNDALEIGLNKIDQLVYLIQSPHPSFRIKDYYTKYISYHLTDEKKKALTLFLNKIQSYPHQNILTSPTQASRIVQPVFV